MKIALLDLLFKRGEIVKQLAFLACGMALALISTAASAQTSDFLTDCEKIDAPGTERDIRYNNCYDTPDGSFYGEAYLDFRIANTDFNRLISQSDRATRRNLLRALGSLFVSNTDVAHFVLLAKANTSDGSSISLGASPLFSIKRVSRNRYTVQSESHFGPLPVRFPADPNSSVDFKIGVLVEREATSTILQKLAKLAQFSGVGLPSIAGQQLTADQEVFRDLDNEISALMSSSQVISTFVPLYFDNRYAQAYETSFALKRFLPDGANFNLKFRTAAEASILVNAGRESSERQGLAVPGGLLAEQFKTTSFMGQPVTNHVLKAIGLQKYHALRSANNLRAFDEACYTLQTWLDTGPLPLTAADKLRVMWAHVSANPLLKQGDARNSYCLASKEPDLRALGLGMPEVDIAPLSDEYYLLYDHARSEADSARDTVDAAIRVRDEALAAADAAELGTNPALYGQATIATYALAGERNAEGESFLGRVRETTDLRRGNTYAGQLVMIGNSMVFQGLGEYRSVNSADDIGFRTLTGRWEGNYGTGNGEIRFKDGSIFTGEISREKPHGFGIWTEADGTIYYVRAFDGERRGQAVREDSDGTLVGGRFISPTVFRPND